MAKNDPCWDGYKQVGTKMKNGKKVPNCVPSENSLIIKKSETTFSTRQQARNIRSEALTLIETANEFTTNTRRVNRRSAFRVISRSLHSSEGLPFSVRKHQALVDLSNYISLAKHNKVVGLTACNTDLLPLTHPRSTRMHSMTASAIIRSQIKWITDDPRITDEGARVLLASAMLAPLNSPEKLYAITRLENLPQGRIPLEALTAAYGGGNSAAAKRARVALQLRDRVGRWVKMFGGLGIKVKRRDGSTQSLSGRAVGQNIYSPQLADVELGDGRIVAVPIRQARGSNFLASPAARKNGFTPAGSTADDMDDPIIEEADLTFMESPSSFDKDERGSKQGTTKYTDQAYDVVKFDDNKRALTDLTETNKRRAAQDLDDAAVDKQGEIDPDSGKQFWDPDRPVYAVSRRGGTPFAYTQSWNDAQQRIQANQVFLDEEEGRKPIARIPQDDNTPEDETPLVDQQDKFKKEEQIDLLPEADASTEKDFKYKVPENTYEVKDPKAPYRSVSEYDDPASLANMFQGDELVEALDDSMETGLGRLQFPDEGEDGGGEQEVPVEAILKAIDEKGGDSEIALAQAYDKRLGTNENEDALLAKRAKDKESKIGEPKKLGEVFDEVAGTPDDEPAKPEAPIAELPEVIEDSEPSELPPLLEGLTPEEQEGFKKNNDYSPYLPKSKEVSWPEGSTPPQARILSEEERAQALDVANADIDDETLIDSYRGAINNEFDEDGFAPFGDLDENNEIQTVQVPSEVLRDAMKLRNIDMDYVNDQIAKGSLSSEVEEEPATEEEPIAEIPAPEVSKDSKGSRSGKDPLKEGWTVDEWLSDLSKDPRFHELLSKNKDFTRLAAFFNDPVFDSPLLSDYQDKDMEGFESGSEVEAIDIGEYGFEPGPASRVKYALDLLEDPTMSARSGFKNPRTGERSNENIKSILKAADEQLELAKLDISESDVFENKAIDSIRATLAKEIAKLDKQIEKDAKQAEEDSIAPQVSYRLRGDRLELRSGKKAPFRDPAVKDFLDDNGFDWNPDAKAETKSGMDEARAREFLRQLRDRFGIDLFPREGQPPIDLEQRDEVIETPALPEASPTVSPSGPQDGPELPEGYEVVNADGQAGSLGMVEIVKDGEQVGYATWNKETKIIENIQVFVGHRGKGLSKVLWSEARKLEPELKHSEYRTPDGDRFAHSSGGYVPPLKNMGDWTNEQYEEAIQRGSDQVGRMLKEEEDLADKFEQEDMTRSDAQAVAAAEMKKKYGVSADEALLNLPRDEAIKVLDENEKRIRGEQPTPTPEPDAGKDVQVVEPTPEEDVFNEAFIDSIKDDEKPLPPYETLLTRLKNKLRDTLQSPEKREESLRFQIMMKTVIAEFGLDALKLDFPNRRQVKQMLFDLEELSTEDLKEVGRLINSELGWPFIKRLGESGRKAYDPSEDGEQTIIEPDAKPEEPLDESNIEDAVIVDTSKPEVSRKISALTSELLPGDITTSDFFTITKVESGLTKLRNKEEVPASRITGYYPGSVEQSTKLWADDVSFDVFRGVTLPPKGDLPELSKPELKSFGDGKLEKVGETEDGRNIFELRDKAAQAEYEAKLAEYNEELARRMATWQAPQFEEEAPTFTPENTLHVVNGLGKDLKPNDIAFRRDENGELGEFFVIEEVLPGTVMVERADGKPAEEKVQIRGYYPGHESQVKSWKVGTPVEVLRGEQAANIPAKGDKPAIDSIEPGTLKGQAYKDKNAEISVARKESGKAYTPNLTATDIPTVLVEKPSGFSRGNRPAFFGTAAELAELKDGKAISDALKGKRVVFFDFETVGTGKFDNDNPDAPIQLAASVYEGGEKVGEINLFINPAEPLGDYYYKIDADGNRVLDPEKLLTSDGQTVDDAFLASQPSIGDQLRAFAEFAGKDAIFVAHNAEFDTNTFEQWAKKLGIDYNIEGVIDTLELAKSMTPKGNKLGQVAKRYGIEKTDEEWHDARTDSEVLPAILEGLLGDMTPDNKEFDTAARLAEFNAKRSSYNQKMEAYKKQQAELAAASAVRDALGGKTVSTEELVDSTKTKSEFGPEGSTDSAEEYAYESIFGEKINDTWIEDDENTYIVNEGDAKVQDIKIGDFVPAEGGGYHEVIDLLQDPEDPNGTVVVRRIVKSGDLYSTRVTAKKSPGIGWSNGQTLKGTLRRRNELAGKTPAEIKKSLAKPVVVDPTPTVKPKTTVTKGSKTARPDEVQGTVSDAIETITSGAKSDSSVAEAVKGLPIDDTAKSIVLEERTDGSKYHLSASGVPLKVGDKVRGTKTGRIGEVRAFIPSYGSRGYKNYVKVKFDDASKRENVSAGALEIINPDDGSGFFVPDKPPATGEPINPNVGPKSESELVSILKSPDEPTVADAEERSRAWKENEEKRMARALELNYRQVSPKALQALNESVKDNAEFDKGYKTTVTGFMPNLSTGEPLDRSFIFTRASARDVIRNTYEPEDILVSIGPSSVVAVIESDGKIQYFDNRSAPNWRFSVYSVDINNAIENTDKNLTEEISNLKTMGMVPLNREIPRDVLESPDDDSDPDFLSDALDTEPKTLKPSKQQEAIIAAVASGKDIIVQALAGTGKTTTLKMAARAVAEQNPDKTILYIAFNKSVAAGLNTDPDRPKNLVARTDSQVAWHHSPKWMQDRGFKKDSIFGNLPTADYLGIRTVQVVQIKPDGTKSKVDLSRIEATDLVKKAVIQFSQSSDEEVMPKHFQENIENVPASLIKFANDWWSDISDPKGELSVNQSFFTKYVQLNGIDVSKASLTTGETRIPAADIIFFDEAQDINDVTGDWVRKQKLQKVFVGDGNQSIYQFRGARNQLDTLESAETLQLTESYRFGPNIAAVANRFLTFKGKTEKVVGLSKNQGELVNIEDMPNPDAVLVRTNGGALKEMEKYLEQGKTVGISQSLKTRIDETLETIAWLSGGKKGKKPDNYNPEIGTYDSFEELGVEVAAGRANGVKSLYDLYVRNGAENIRQIMSRVIVKEEDTDASKAARAVYSPITIDQAEDGSSGVLSSDVKYKIVGDSIVLEVGFVKNDYYRKLLNDNLKKVGMPARKTGKQFKNSKGELKDEWVRDASIPDDLDRTDKLNKIKKGLNGIIDPVKPDLVITTAHIAKGDEFDNLIIGDDFAFFGPKPDKTTGEIKMPDEQEVNLAYVAVTRAKKKLVLGPLSWIYDYTEESDEEDMQSISNLQEMSSIPTDSTPVTPEEFDNEVKETAKKADPATQRIADAIIAALERGTAPWRKPWTGGGFLPTSVATGKMYEGSNVISLWAAQEANGWTDNRWLTYKQAEKLGGNIKRGEKATAVIHWAPKFKTVEQPDGTTKEQFVYTPPKIINLFNVEQAEGIDLPPLVKGEPIPVSQAEQTLLDTYKDRPEIFYKSQDSAYYSPSADTIHLPLREQFGAEQDLFETLVHELAHSTGHTSRVNRKELLDNYGNHRASRGEEELIAEISVALVAARLGVEIDFGNVASYAKSWLGSLKNDPTMIIKAAKQAQKAVDHMLGKQEEPAKFDEDGNPVEPVGEGVGSEGKTGEEIAEDSGLKPETAPEPNVGEQGKTGEEIAQEDDIKPAGIKGGHDLSPREVFNNNRPRSDSDVRKVYDAEEVYQAQLQRKVKPPVAPKRADFQDSASYIAAHKKYSKEYDDMYREISRNIQSPIGERNLDGSKRGVQNYVKDIITADWFVEAFGDGGQMGRPPVSLVTSKKAGGKYSYGFRNGVYESSLKINNLLSKSEPNILHEIAHFATAISMGEGFDAHGIEYRMNYIFITNKVRGREAAESLKEAYRKANLNVG